MKRRTRYLFLALGFLIFGVLSPLIVLYVSGVSYDWSTDQLSATGLLSIRSVPSKADVYLDGQKQGTSPLTIRFLKAKDYTITVKKEGYFDWTKTLQLKNSQVTWASANLQELHLLRNDPAPVIVAGNVKDYFTGSDFALYLTDSSLIKTELGQTTTKQAAKLPASCDSLTVSPTENLVLVLCGNKNYLYDRDTLKQIQIPLSAGVSYIFGEEDSLYSVEKGNLFKTDSGNGKRTQVATGVADFAFQDGSLYRLQTSGTGFQLVISPIYSPDQTQILIDSLPTFKSVKLYVARSKEVFLLADGNLYRVNNKLDQIQSGVTEVGFDANAPALAYTTGFEVYNYDFTNNSQQLILRDASGLGNPEGVADAGYVLFSNDNKIQAAEVDTRDHVNTYTLANTAQLKKYTTDPGHNLVYLLDGSSLKFFRLK